MDIAELLQQANNSAASGNFAQAVVYAEQALIKEAHNFPALQIAVMANFQLGNVDQAQRYLDKALTSYPQHPLFHNLKGVMFCQQGDYSRGIEFCKRAVELQPNYSEAIYNLALAYQRQGDLSQALHYLYSALEHAPNIPNIYDAIGTILYQQGNFVDAIKMLQKALQIAPNYLTAWFNLANVYNYTNNIDKAVECYQKVIAYNPQIAEAHDNLGLMLQKLGRYTEAIASFERALQCNSKLKSAALNLSSLLAAGDMHVKACEVLHAALQLHPNDIDLLVFLVHAKKACCDWNNLENLENKLLQQVEQQLASNIRVSLAPFASLSCWTSAKQQYAIAKNHAKFYMQNFPQKLHFDYSVCKENKKIKLAYISPNFKNHPTAQNVLGMLQRHDRSKFEIYIYALNEDDGSIERKNIVSAADHFCDLTNLNYLEAAKKINADGINVIISLMGYIDKSRVEILANHPCPVQIGYQSFAGTLGNDIYNYFVADKIVVPAENTEFYSEKIINMPYSYYAIDVSKPSGMEVSRQECDLPENKFVYCCFCSHYKVEPQVFAMWMKILHAVPNSVLWLFGKLDHVKRNLCAAAKNHGVGPERLIFARGRNKQYHLARHQHADLFLDTLIYGAHTTAVDALKMGVPLITLPGNTLVTRVSAALLRAINLPELIVQTRDDYVKTAIYYAEHPNELKHIKQKLVGNFHTAPLFKIDDYVRYFENGVTAAWDIYQRGEQPRQIDIK